MRLREPFCNLLVFGETATKLPTQRARAGGSRCGGTHTMASRPVTFVAGVLAGAALTSLLTPVRHEVLPP